MSTFTKETLVRQIEDLERQLAEAHKAVESLRQSLTVMQPEYERVKAELAEAQQQRDAFWESRDAAEQRAGQAEAQRDALVKYAVHSFPECPLSQSESLFYNVGPCACELDALLASLPGSEHTYPAPYCLACQTERAQRAEDALTSRAAEPDGRVQRALRRLIEAINSVNARTGASEMSCVFCRAVDLSLAHAETCPLYEAEDALRWAEPDGLREALPDYVLSGHKCRKIAYLIGRERHTARTVGSAGVHQWIERMADAFRGRARRALGVADRPDGPCTYCGGKGCAACDARVVADSPSEEHSERA